MAAVRGSRGSIRCRTWRSAPSGCSAISAGASRTAPRRSGSCARTTSAPALLLSALAERFAQRGSGILVGVSSVAGDRGRAANYVYGSAKAGFTAFLSGLRNRLARSGVHVLTVKPGFVRTRMTAGMNLPEHLTATPDEVAAAVAEALRTGRDVVYVRRIWRLIMWAVRAMPERVFKRMKM